MVVNVSCSRLLPLTVFLLSLRNLIQELFRPIFQKPVGTVNEATPSGTYQIRILLVHYARGIYKRVPIVRQLAKFDY